MTHPSSPLVDRRRQRGFNLVELSMVLIVIALILGAVAVGGDVQRNASYQKIGSSFVRAWQQAYLSYKTKIGVVLKDSQTTPTGYVNANTTGVGGQDVCTTTLRAEMLAAGVEMPQGRAEGKEFYYSYLDSNGNPQQVEVCFRTILWMLETATPGTYDNQVKNVMVIKQVTPDLARLIDSLVDTARDAQFGKVRQFPTSATLINPPAREYSLDNRCAVGETDCSAVVVRDEAQVATMTIYMLLD